MPRIAGVSAQLDRVADPPQAEALSTVAPASRLKPIGLLTSVIVDACRSSLSRRSSPCLLRAHRGAPPARSFLAAQPRDRSGSLQLHRAPSNVALTTLCGLAMPSDLVRMFWMPADSTIARTAPPAMTPVPSEAGLSSTWPAPKWPTTACGIVVPAERHADHVLLRHLDALLDGRRHFLGLAEPKPTTPVAVADDDQRAEAEVLAALDDLGDAVDVDDLVLELELRSRRSARSLTFASCRCLLELQAGFARRVGEALDAAVIEVAAAVEDDPLDALVFSRLAIAAPTAFGAGLCCRRGAFASSPFSAGSRRRGRRPASCRWRRRSPARRCA